MPGALSDPITPQPYKPRRLKRPQLARSEYGFQLRIQLLSLLAPSSCCASCGVAVEIEALEIDHVDGRTWCGRQLNFLDRIRRQWREYDANVPLRALCRHCNASDGARRKGTPRYASPATMRRAA